MINIFFNKDSDWEVNEEYITQGLSSFLLENGVDYRASLSVMIATEKRLEMLAVKYMGETKFEAKGHPVLSFCEDEVEGEFVLPPENREAKYLGEIVASYEYAVSEARHKKESVDAVLLEWIKHGALHLLGIHHE